MDKELVAKYLNKLKDDTGLTIEAIARKSGRSESSVKNLLYANVDDPRLDTVTPIVYALKGSVDEMLNPGKSRDGLNENSGVQRCKDGCVFREMHETHNADIKEHYENRLADKKEIIDNLKKECLHAKILSWVCVLILVGLLILEVSNPKMGWIQF